MRRTRFLEGGDDAALIGYVDLAEDAADVSRNGFALVGLEIEDRHLRVFCGERTRRRLAQRRSAAGDDCGDILVQCHCLPLFVEIQASIRSTMIAGAMPPPRTW